MAPSKTISALGLFGIVLLFGTGLANAHEHHGENIPEGEVVSPDPLVSERIVNTFQHAMDPG